MNNQQIFEPGELVTLKSGGQIMTVNDFNPCTDKVECVWFEDDKLKTNEFYFEVLRLYDEEAANLQVSDEQLTTETNKVIFWIVGLMLLFILIAYALTDKEKL